MNSECSQRSRLKQRTTKPLTLTYVLALSAALHQTKAMDVEQWNSNYKLEGYASHNIRVRFRGAETAYVGLIKEGDGIVKLTVYAPSGRLAFASQIAGDRVLLTCIDNEEGLFTIRVENAGPISCRYVLGANASVHDYSAIQAA